jgi:phosphoglycerol transferase MdoB-like AlkP superfamily enzyme
MDDQNRASVIPDRADALTVAPALRAAASIMGGALSLIILGMFIRARMTGVLILDSLGERLTSPAALVHQVVVGTYWDVVATAVITLPFLCLIYALRHRMRALRALAVVYWIIAAVVLAAEAANPTVVFYLGTPFTLQWLYYSDFLRGLDARNSLFAILDARTVVAALAGFVAFIILALILRRVIASVMSRPYRGRIAAVVCAVALAYFSVGYFELNRLELRRSLTANPVIVFADSLLPHNVPAIYTMTTPVTAEDFAQAAERDPAPVMSTNAPTAAGIKNVLVFVLESVSSKYVEAYGSKFPVTPVLNQYRSQAMMFDSIYAHTANTNVSLVALLTSTYPWLSTQFVTREYPGLPVHSLTGLLRERGYSTAYFTAADDRFDGQNDFLAQHDVELQEDYRSIPCDRTVNNAGFEQAVHDLVARRQYFEGVHDDCTADALNHWIDTQHDRPFFALMWTFMTHHPYFVAGAETDFGVDNDSENRYLNALRISDAALGKVLRHLEDAELADSTLVVVFGDHGEAFGRHGQVAHASNIYEENVHIPLFLINPRLFKGEESNVVGGIVDIGPTILDILRLPMPGDWQGRSLFAQQRSPRTYFFTPWADLIYGYRQANTKYIYNLTTNEFAIYDLAADPGESHNLIDAQPEMKDEVTNRLAAWIQYQNALITRLTSVASEPPDSAIPSPR